MRGIGGIEFVQAAVPEWTTPFVVALTALGDPLVVLVLVTVVYWVGPRADLVDRRDAARLAAAGFVAVAATLLLKGAFALPRPPAALHRIPEDGYGFPSGHAVGATVVYAGLASVADRGTLPARGALAVAAVATVALTRVVLGVHYLVDVVAGVAVGLAVLAGVLWVTRVAVPRGFGLAAVVGAGAVAATGATVETTLAVAGPVGALGTWVALDRRDVTRGSAPAGVVVAGTAVVVGGGVGTLAAEPPLVAVAAVGGVLGAAVVAVPAAQNFSR